MSQPRQDNLIALTRALLRDVVLPKRRTILWHQANVTMSVREFANVAAILELIAEQREFLID